jgi:SPASM domain peptide maturase of grasp-with-spasm system
MNRYKIIPNELYDVLTRIELIPYEEMRASFFDKEGLDLYIEKLLKENFLFYTDIPKQFPKLSMLWDYPSIITNAIIDLNATSDYDTTSAIQQLDYLGCKALEIRFFDSSFDFFLNTILKALKDSKISFVQIITSYNEMYQTSYFEKIYKQNPRFSSFIVHSSPFYEQIGDENSFTLNYTQDKVDSEMHCGYVNSDYFTVNIPMFTEAQEFNTCLNRKLSIDKDGNIKNCPAIRKTYGHINSTQLSSVIILDTFKELWSINKNQIDICKDCEFRYICTDCRALIKDENNIYSKPKFCNYDPYTSTWQ